MGLCAPACLGSPDTLHLYGVHACMHVQAVDIALEGVYELNACVPYSGVPPGVRVEPITLAVCLALLHPDLVPGEPAARKTVHISAY